MLPLKDLTLLLIIMTVIISLLGIFIAILIYLHKEKQLVYLKRIDTLKSEIQDATCKYFSQEIHDHVNHALTISKRNLEELKNQSEQDALKISFTTKLIDRSISELTQISIWLKNRIGFEKLEDVLEEKTKILQALGIFAESKISGQPVRLDSEKEETIIRIIEEAISNIIKHSRTKTVQLNLAYNINQLEVLINDKGRGFDLHIIEKEKNSAGLNNIRSRTEEINGIVKIISLPGHGTSIRLTIPYQS